MSSEWRVSEQVCKICESKDPTGFVVKQVNKPKMSAMCWRRLKHKDTQVALASTLSSTRQTMSRPFTRLVSLFIHFRHVSLHHYQDPISGWKSTSLRVFGRWNVKLLSARFGMIHGNHWLNWLLDVEAWRSKSAFLRRNQGQDTKVRQFEIFLIHNLYRDQVNQDEFYGEAMYQNGDESGESATLPDAYLFFWPA